MCYRLIPHLTCQFSRDALELRKLGKGLGSIAQQGRIVRFFRVLFLRSVFLVRLVYNLVIESLWVQLLLEFFHY